MIDLSCRYDDEHISDEREDVDSQEEHSEPDDIDDCTCQWNGFRVHINREKLSISIYDTSFSRGRAELLFHLRALDLSPATLSKVLSSEAKWVTSYTDIRKRAEQFSK